MKSRSVVQMMCLLTAAAVAAGSLSAAPRDTANRAATGQADDWNFHDEASRLLKEVQSTATVLTRDADILHSFTRGSLSWESHVNQISLIKNHINSMGKQLDRLQAIRHVAAPWQQQAIDSVVPAALILAAHTEAAIEHLNDRSKSLWDSEYANHLQGIFDRSDRVKETVGLHLEIADTQDQLEQLRERTETLGS